MDGRALLSSRFHEPKFIQFRTECDGQGVIVAMCIQHVKTRSLDIGKRTVVLIEEMASDVPHEQANDKALGGSRYYVTHAVGEHPPDDEFVLRLLSLFPRVVDDHINRVAW